MKNEDRFLKELGERLRELRKAKGLTQEQIALDTGIDRGFISEIENGHKNPSMYTMARILRYLKVGFASLD